MPFNLQENKEKIREQITKIKSILNKDDLTDEQKAREIQQLESCKHPITFYHVLQTDGEKPVEDSVLRSTINLGLPRCFSACYDAYQNIYLTTNARPADHGPMHLQFHSYEDLIVLMRDKPLFFADNTRDPANVSSIYLFGYEELIYLNSAISQSTASSPQRDSLKLG